MGNKDIPASLNYVLSVTGQDKLVYIGHSLGGALFFVAMTQHPELNSKIDVMIGMAPASAVANVQTYYALIFRYFNLIQVRTVVKFSYLYQIKMISASNGKLIVDYFVSFIGIGPVP